MTAGPGAPRRALAAGVLSLRDRLLSSPGFRRLAARFVLTRPVARRRTRALFDLSAGFVHAQVLAACVELRLFDLVAAGPLSCAELAGRCDLPPDGMQTLVRAATGLGLLQARQGLVGLGAQGAALRGNAGVLGMIAHHAMLYDDLRDPVALLRRPRGGTRLAGFWGYAGAGTPGDGAVQDYSGLMGASQPMIADEVLAAYRFGRHRCLLDVGGGDGSFLAAVGRAAPRLRLMLVDLPEVAALAETRLAAAGLGGRAVCVGGISAAPGCRRGRIS